MRVPVWAQRLGFRALRRVPETATTRAAHVVLPTSLLGAMAWVTRPDDGRVLLVKPTYRPAWILPGGLLQRHEAPRDGAVRETVEETGLEIRLTGEPVVVVDLAARVVDVVFAAAPAPGVGAAVLDALRPRSPEIDEVAWVAAEEVPDRCGSMRHKVTALARADELGSRVLVLRSPDEPLGL